MLVSYEWFKSETGVKLSYEEMKEVLINRGIEVDGVYEIELGDVDELRVCKVVEKKPLKIEDGLYVVSVDAGDIKTEVVSKDTGFLVGDTLLYAPVGIVLNGYEIKRKEISGVVSDGLLIAKQMLGLEEKSDTHWFLPDFYSPGKLPEGELPKKDYIFELSITPNRGDILSLLGLAYELYDHIERLPKYRYKGEIDIRANRDGDFVEVLDYELCPRYCGLLVRDVRIMPSPVFMVYRLHKSGINSINNVVDITNYIMLLYGNPNHAFNYHKINGRVIVRRAMDGEVLRTLDDKEHRLSRDDIVIADEKGAIALGGVMGGKYSEISDDTKDVFLEVAYFKPEAIRRTAKRLGISTEASYRFERGVDILSISDVIRELAWYMMKYANGASDVSFIDKYRELPDNKKIKVRRDYVGKVLGKSDIWDKAYELLKKIGIEANREGEVLEVLVPPRRRDLNEEIDIIEELARVYGYNNFPSELPPIRSNVDSDKVYENIMKVKHFLASCGLNEVISFPFTSEKEGGSKEESLFIVNPLSKIGRFLSKTLLYRFLEIIAHNVSNYQNSVAIYEVAKAFYKDFTERDMLAVGLYGEYKGNSWHQKGRDYDFYDLKAIYSRLFSFLGLDDSYIKIRAIKDDEINGYLVEYKDEYIGRFGKVSDKLALRYNIKKKVWFFEMIIPWDECMVYPEGRFFEEFSVYPPTYREITFLMKDEVSAEEIGKYIYNFSSLIKSVDIISVYKGKPVPDGEKSISYKILFSSLERTLTDDEVNKLQDDIIKAVRERFGAYLRAG